MKIKKGQYGYRDSNKRMRLAITAVLLAAILAQLFARALAESQAAKNILTVMAILTVLPMANMASPLLASWKYRTPGAAFYEKVHPYEEKYRILYDLIITTKDLIMPLDAIAVHPQGVFAFCTSAKLNTAKAEKALETLFADNRLGLSVRVITDERSFFRRLDSLKPASGYEDDGSVDYTASLLKSQSM